MLRRPLAPIEDDTEDAPWMVMGSPQYDAATEFGLSLRYELNHRQPRPYVVGMLPIHYVPAPGEVARKLAPDVLVAPVPIRPRSSYFVELEGVPPSFVLEIISPESKTRDLREKPDWYAHMGVQEYAIFAPVTPEGRQLLDPPLQGYRLTASRDDYELWPADARGRLWSEVLRLWLVVRDGELRAQRPDGSWVPTPREERSSREAAESRVQRLEAELARLREELAKGDKG